MQEPLTFFPQDFYSKHLSSIHDISFTKREIDVISCILSARRTSKIAGFLSIDSRTVETHIRNIMSKLDCNTQESIIDFVEASDKIPFLRKYYSLLRIEVIFEKHLRVISKLNRDPPLTCLLIPGDNKDSFFPYLSSHLKFIGIKASTTVLKKENNVDIVILSTQLLTKKNITSFLNGTNQDKMKVFLFLRDKSHYQAITKEFVNFDVIDCTRQEYYFSFLNFLRKLFQDINLDKAISDFRNDYQTFSSEFELLHISSNARVPENHKTHYTKYYIILALLLIGFTSTGFLAFYWNQGKNEPFFRSDLIIPTTPILLNRPDLISQIDDKLQKHDDIQTVALVGPGGAGKTTLALNMLICKRQIQYGK